MSLSQLARFIVTGSSQSKCEACGEAFACGATLTGCWCSELKLTDEARAEMRARYSGCLCRKCLEKSAEQALPNPQDANSA